MTTIELVIFYVVALAVLVGWGLWLDRDARRTRKMMRRMAVEVQSLSIAIGEQLVPSFVAATAAIDGFVQAWSAAVDTEVDA